MMRNNIVLNEPLSRHTSWKVGGPADIFFTPNDRKDLSTFFKSNDCIITWLGNGTNILVRDAGVRGAVISTRKSLNKIELIDQSNYLIEVGVSCFELATYATKNNFGPAAFFSGIPGSIGGALTMNAGCFGKEFKDILVSVQAIDKFGRVITIPSKQINFEYRKSNIPDDYIFLSASFKGFKSNQKEIKATINKLKFEKEKNQPTRIKTSGSTFKNPISQSNKKVWELIRDSVPLNQSFGDACISEKHCNFFVNKGNAKFQDMKKLIDYVSEKVLKKTGISLEKEIKILE